MNSFALPDFTPPSYEHVVDAYGLEILKELGDWSTVGGDLRLAKDGDIQVGDTAYSALFRLVQEWRLTAPHLRHLFDLMTLMQVCRKDLDDKMNRDADEKRAQFDIRTYLKTDEQFIAVFQQNIDEQGAADYGLSTYAGCAALILSSSLNRFMNDLDAKSDDWTKTAPLFNGRSLGQVIVAAANGCRHGDEWAKTWPPTAQQKKSQEVLATALAGSMTSKSHMPGRCPEVLEMLSGEHGFDGLVANLFAFSHNVALRKRTPFEP